MVSSIKNDDDFIVAYMEWQILDDSYQFKNGGNKLYIQDVWIHNNNRTGFNFYNKIFKIILMAILLDKFSFNVDHLDFRRSKYNNKERRKINIHHIIKRLGEDNGMVK